MSMPLTIIYCSKCDYSDSISQGGFSYVYQLRNGDKVLAPIQAGWCMKCNKIQIIQCGLSVKSLTDEIGDFNRRLIKIEGIRDIVQMMSKFDIEEAEVIRKKSIKKQKYLSVLDGKDSVHSCIECSSNEVFPMQIAPEGISWPEETTYSHINCGGQFKIKQSEAWFRFVEKDVVIKPVFSDLIEK
jgi:hypothetical protein